MGFRGIRLGFFRVCKDLRRVVSPVYLMGYVGQRMYRTAIRRTGLIGLAALSVSIVGQGLGFLPAFTVRKAAIFTGVYGLVTLFGGFGLRTISNLLMSERINVAEANNLNLLEDKKKSHLQFYLRRLYDSVFRFEAAVRYSDEEVRREEEQIRKNVQEITEKLNSLSRENLSFLGVNEPTEMVDHMSACKPFRPEELEKSWEGFRITANYALTHPLPATLEAHIIGFDLTMVEDWLDGACFDANDVKLLEQYKANSTMVVIKRQVGYRFMDRMWQRRKAFSHGFWFQNTFRSVAIGVGAEIKKMNRRVCRGYFKAEHFLWMHPDLDRCVEREFGNEVLQELISRRKRLLWKIFSHRHEGAVELLRRIYRPKIELAIDLRKRFDVEYFLGELNGESYLRDLERLSFCPRRIRKERERVERAKKADALLARYLSEKGEVSSRPLTALQRRALRIALHLNFSHLRDLLFRHSTPRTGEEDAREVSLWGEELQRAISEGVAAEPLFSHRLVTLRIFCLLNWLEFEEYCRHVKEIAYAEEDACAFAS